MKSGKSIESIGNCPGSIVQGRLDRSGSIAVVQHFTLSTADHVVFLIVRWRPHVAFKCAKFQCKAL